MITINGETIEHGDDRVKEVIQMGKGLGLTFKAWYAILKVATIRMELAFHAKGQAIALEVECDCENCKKNRNAHRLTLVPTPPTEQQGGVH